MDLNLFLESEGLSHSFETGGQKNFKGVVRF
jgi:hypothetical protein